MPEVDVGRVIIVSKTVSIIV